MKAKTMQEIGGADVRQLARDAVHALYRGDRAAVDRIYRSVPRRKCVVLDREFETLVDGFSSFKALWSADHWRERFASADALRRLREATDRGDQVLAGICRDQHREAEARLLAADQVFDELCEQHGLDAELMRESGGIGRYEATNADAVNDPEHARYGGELRCLAQRVLSAAGAGG